MCIIYVYIHTAFVIWIITLKHGKRCTVWWKKTNTLTLYVFDANFSLVSPFSFYSVGYKYLMCLAKLVVPLSIILIPLLSNSSPCLPSLCCFLFLLLCAFLPHTPSFPPSFHLFASPSKILFSGTQLTFWDIVSFEPHTVFHNLSL